MWCSEENCTFPIERTKERTVPCVYVIRAFSQNQWRCRSWTGWNPRAVIRN